MVRFDADEVAQRRAIREAFKGCRIYCRRDRRAPLPDEANGASFVLGRSDPRRFVARIDLPSRSWCSSRGTSRADAVKQTFALACEPAPGFPGWSETLMAKAFATFDDARTD